jgi:Ca2+-binding RTX toxin-like protein
LGSNFSDKLEGSKKSETMIGASGSDILDGGGGEDIIIGASPELGGGKGEVDEMTGGKGKDIFVLGTEDGVLYDDGKKKKNGKKDYAVITDFNPKQDSMQLHGHRDDYFVDDYQKNGQGWQGVVYDSNQNGLMDRSDELIAQIPADLGLRDSVLKESIRNADFV